MDSVAARNGGQEDELKGRKRKISLTNCSVCSSNEARYRCPGCLKHSCSLTCVKRHKEVSRCSGVRDKTAFVALSQFDEMNLLSDYRLLEDTGRIADSANRDRLICSPSIRHKIRTLAAPARKMNMTLRLLPTTFTKSKENSTYFLKSENQFLWHLKLLFPQSECTFVVKRMGDEQTLEQILTPYIHPTKSEPVRRQKLKMYVHSHDHVKVFMKAEGRKANSVRYHELDLKKSLRENLRFKTVIEYPVLHVVLKDHWQDYPLKGPAGKAWLGNDQREGVTCISLLHPGPAVLMGTQQTIPDSGPPKKKKAKRDPMYEELEDGEILDSDDDDDDDDDDDNIVNMGYGNNTVGGLMGGDEKMTCKRSGSEPHSVHEPSGQTDSHGGEIDSRVGENDCHVLGTDSRGGETDSRGGKNDSQALRADNRIGETDNRIGETDNRIGETDNRIGETDNRIGETDSRVGETDSRVGETDSRVGETDGHVLGTDGRVGKTDGRVGETDSHILEIDSHVLKPCKDGISSNLDNL